MSIQTTPVAIVGGGPVGLMLALFLDRHGVASVVFNSDSEVRRQPKGSTHNARTMEHYRRLGFADEVRALGLPADHPTDVAYFTRFDGWELARLRMPSAAEKLAARAAAPATDQVPEPIHRANQMYVERAIFARAAARPGITLRFGWRVANFEQDAAGVSIHAVREGNGAEERWRASWLAGCDGGRSSVRRALGIRYAGFENLQQAFFGGAMLSCHVRAPTLYRDILGGRRAFQYWALNPELRTAMVALDGREEFLLWMRSDAAGVDDHAVRAAMQACAGRPIEVEVLGSYPWTAGVALHAERFGDGRVWLAGDAVHLFTPTGGFGMNTGVGDIVDLSWKITAMLQGWGGPKLLDSYTPERRPVAERNVREAAGNLGRMLSPAPTKAFLTPSPEGEAERRKVGEDFSIAMMREWKTLGIHLGYFYEASPIIVSDGAPAPSLEPAVYEQTTRPGSRAPHVWLKDGRSTLDLLGKSFALLRLGADAPSGESLIAAAKACALPLDVVTIDEPAVIKAYERKLVLVRPDGHCCWRGDAEPTDAMAVIDTVRGA